ncbi:nuclear transport factor 2 family protein [Crocinitomix sp.]|nr:nuclear transport factor 2 family protein [Crocinitomix sp.]
MKYIVGFLAILSTLLSYSQNDLEGLTRDFYAALNKGDSTETAAFFHPTAHIKHVSNESVWDLSLAKFLGECPKFLSDYYAEDVMDIAVQTFESGLSYVDVYFDFYVDGSYSHSGVDHICWSTREGELKIESVYSSDFKNGFPVKDNKASMDLLMNKWHNDVAVFDFEAYFGFMSDDFIFLGTDPSERWTKEAFANYSKPYFDRKSTWDFKTNWRNWYFSDDYSMAWFEESLDTQMEECRGSGVLSKVDGEWKIAYYNLSVVIENEKMRKFIKLRRK